MQPVLYAGLRNPGRDKAIADAMASMPTAEVCEQFSINPSTARKAAKRVADLCIFELRLTGGGKDMPLTDVRRRALWRPTTTSTTPMQPSGSGTSSQPVI